LRFPATYLRYLVLDNILAVLFGAHFLASAHLYTAIWFVCNGEYNYREASRNLGIHGLLYHGVDFHTSTFLDRVLHLI